MVARKTAINNPVLSRLSKRALYMAIAAAMSGTCLFSANASAAGLVTTTGVQALMATETVTGKSQTTVASIGPLTNESSSEQQSGLESNIDSSSLAVVPVNASLGSTIYSSNQDAENAVSGYLKNYEQQIADAVVGSMKSSGTETQLGIFTYIQNVQIANPSGGSPSKEQVYATVQVQPNGSYQFLGTNVNNDKLYLLYAIYQQSKDAAYLPAGWTVPYAGETRWELDQITEEGDTIQSAPVSIDGSVWHTIQDNGAYDGTETVTNGVEKINYAPGVESLMQNQMKALMNQYNASLAVVMYGEQVKVSRNSAGQPLTAISVNSRVLERSCGSPGTFKNTGQYGYLLTEVENEYIVQPSGSYADAGQVQANTISPTESYSESAATPAGASAANYEEDLVFPIAPDQGQIIDWESGEPLPTSDYVYVAPLTNNTDAGSYIPNIGDVCVSNNDAGPFTEVLYWANGDSAYIPYDYMIHDGMSTDRYYTLSVAENAFYGGYGYSDIYAPEVSINGKQIPMGNGGYDISEYENNPIFPQFDGQPMYTEFFLRCTAISDEYDTGPYFWGHGYASLGKASSGCSVLVDAGAGLPSYEYPPYNAYWCPAGGGQCDYMGQTYHPLGSDYYYGNYSRSSIYINDYNNIPYFPGVPDDSYSIHN